jgi:hypothetical protein
MQLLSLDRRFDGRSAENAALLTGRCRLRYCGMVGHWPNFALW